MGNYTEGEWKVTFNGYDYQIITDSGNDYILIGGTKGKANAHLIAAAPDQHKVLEEVDTFLVELINNAHDSYWVTRAKTYRGIVNKALVKAEEK